MRIWVRSAGLICGGLLASLIGTAPAAHAEASRPLALAFFNGDAGDYSALADLNQDHISDLAPTGLYLAADGGLQTVADEATIVTLAHARGVRVLPVVQNYRDGAFQPGDLNRLTQPAARSALTEAILRSVAGAGADGVDLDLEELPGGLAPAFASFVRELAVRFHAGGRTVVVDLPADDRAYDPAALQLAADRILLMAYDQHNLPGAPGPVAAYPWVVASLQHLRTAVPGRKIILGLAGYGYDWGPGTVQPVSFEQAVSGAGSPGAIHWDAAAREPWYTYAASDGGDHTVWFSDAASLQPLVRLAELDGLAGVGLWRLGLEDRALWQLPGVQGAGSIEGLLAGVTVRPSLSGSGQVLGEGARPSPGRRSVTVDATAGEVDGERYLALPQATRLRATGLREGTVALTFDDGPDPRWTPQILDILRRHHARATFFVIGRQAAQHPELLARMYGQGDEVADHTYTHSPSLGRASPWHLSLELSLTQRVIEAATGHSATLFRFPYSSSLADLEQGGYGRLQVPIQQGYWVVGTGTDTSDWTRPGPRAIASAALTDPDGQIILLHDGGGDRSQTVAALPAILAGLQARGLQIVPVAEAVGESPAAAMPLASRSELPLDDLVLGSVWSLGHATLLWVYAVNAVALLACVRIGGLGALGLLHQAVGDRPPRFPYRGPVSVVIPARNEQTVIARTLEALLDSDYPGLDIIVVDDGSQDRTAAVAAAFVSHGIRLLERPQSGKAAALRAGFEAARHPVVVALDADTLFATSTVRRLVEPFGDPRIGAVAGNPRVGNRGTLLARFQTLEYVLTLNLERRAYSLLGCVPVVPGAVGAWRRNAVAAVGGFTGDTLAEDTDVTLALGRAGYRVRYVPSAVAFTEAPQTLRQLTRQRARWSFGMLQCLWKHRAATLNPRAGAFGLVAVPGLWIAQIVFPLIAPTIDAGLLLSPLFAWGPRVLIAAAAYNLLLLLLGAWALTADREPPALVALLPIQNLFYRQFMYVMALRAIVRALRGVRVSWQRVTRLGTSRMTSAG